MALCRPRMGIRILSILLTIKKEKKMGQDYQASKKTAVKIITILGIITVVEVFFALLGK